MFTLKNTPVDGSGEADIFAISYSSNGQLRFYKIIFLM
jgi:hypothetical protein